MTPPARWYRTNKEHTATQIGTCQLATVYATGAFGLSMNAMVTFLLPLRASQLGAPLYVIGAIIGIKGLVEAVLSVPMGSVIDRMGPRRAFVLGAALSALVSLGFAASSTYWGLLAAAAALGAGRCLGWISAQTYVAVLGAGITQARHTGRFSFVSSAGQIGTPLLVAGVAQLTSYQLAFVVVACYSAVFALLGLLGPNVGKAPPSQSPSTGTGIRAAAGLLRLNSIQVAMLLTFVRLWIPATWRAFYPLFLVHSGVDPLLAGTVISGMAIVATIITLSAGVLSRYASPEIITASALGVASAGLASSSLWQSVPAIYIPATLIGIGQGLSLPLLIAVVSNAAPTHQRGLALGLRSSVNQVSAALAPTLVGPLIAGVGIIVGFAAAGAAVFTLLIAAAAMHLRRGHL